VTAPNRVKAAPGDSLDVIFVPPISLSTIEAATSTARATNEEDQPRLDDRLRDNRYGGPSTRASLSRWIWGGKQMLVSCDSRPSDDSMGRFCFTLGVRMLWEALYCSQRAVKKRPHRAATLMIHASSVTRRLNHATSNDKFTPAANHRGWNIVVQQDTGLCRCARGGH
jgi:hypothetical protein